MRVKIFQETGQLGIAALEKKINEWIEEQRSSRTYNFEITDIKIAQSGGGVPDDEIFQCLTVIVMYWLHDRSKIVVKD